MKWLVFALVIGVLPGALADTSPMSAPPPAGVSSHEDPTFDEGSRFIFFAVLEGLYEDGVSNADVDQILLRKPGQGYFHFIYACPVCTATIWALEAYRKRPDSFYSLKTGHSGTFGPGLTGPLHAQLYDADPHVRLAAINSLMQRWMSRRMELLRLTAAEKASLLKKLEAMRQRGMNVLADFRHDDHGGAGTMETEAPAYVDLDECVVCNGAVGKPMKLPGDKAAPSGQPKPSP